MSLLRNELQAIYDRRGFLTPAAVVEEARPKNHPLHSQVFDKAPKEAAEAYYQDRAHELICSVRVRYREATDTDPSSDVRAWHAVRTDEGHVYEPADKVANDPLIAAMVLRDMEREWKALHRRYGSFSEFVELVRRALDEDAA